MVVLYNSEDICTRETSRAFKPDTAPVNVSRVTLDQAIDKNALASTHVRTKAVQQITTGQRHFHVIYTRP